MDRTKVISALRWLTLVMIVACAYVPLEQSPYQDFDHDFEAGITTRGQVVQAFGPPNIARQSYRFVLYEWEADGAFVAHPALAVFACTSPVQTMPGMNRDVLLIEFDDNGLLRRFAVVRNPEFSREILVDRFEAKEPLELAGGAA